MNWFWALISRTEEKYGSYAELERDLETIRNSMRRDITAIIRRHVS